MRLACFLCVCVCVCVCVWQSDCSCFLCICCFNTDSAHQAAHRVLSTAPSLDSPTATSLSAYLPLHTRPAALSVMTHHLYLHDGPWCILTSAQGPNHLDLKARHCVLSAAARIPVSAVTSAFLILLSQPACCELSVNPVIRSPCSAFSSGLSEGVRTKCERTANEESRYAEGRCENVCESSFECRHIFCL